MSSDNRTERETRETVVASRARTFNRSETSGGRVRYSRLSTLLDARCSMLDVQCPMLSMFHVRSRLDAQLSTQRGDKRRADHEFLANIRDLSSSPLSLSSPFSLSRPAQLHHQPLSLLICIASESE